MHSAVSAVESIFCKWKKGGYERPGFSGTIAYLLDHKYSGDSLVFAALKGKDATLISNIQGVAERHGVCLHLGLLECQVSGYGKVSGRAKASGYANMSRYAKRSRYARLSDGYGFDDDFDYEFDDNSDDDWGAPPGMAAGYETKYRIEGLYDSEGDLAKGRNSITLNPEFNMIPQDPGFTSEEPDDKDIGCYVGNVSSCSYPRGTSGLTIIQELTYCM
jgi:hypothetical protein